MSCSLNEGHGNSINSHLVIFEMFSKYRKKIFLWIIFHIIIIENLQNADISHIYKAFCSYTVNGVCKWQTNVGVHNPAYIEKECYGFYCASICLWIGVWTRTEHCRAQVLVGTNLNWKTGTFSQDDWTVKSGTFHRMFIFSFLLMLLSCKMMLFSLPTSLNHRITE